MSLKQHSQSLPQSEWFVPLHIDHVPASGKVVKMSASAAQLKEIAERLDIISMDNLSAEIHASLQNGGHILYLEGQFTVDVVQQCVVTLEPLPSHVEDRFEAWYADHNRAVPFKRAKHQVQTTEEGEEIQMLEEKDDPEPLLDGQVDLGEVVIQFLSLAINPYLRKDAPEDESEAENVVFTAASPSGDGSAASSRPNPFAALKNWRPKD